DRYQRALGKQLADDAAAARADRSSDRKIAPARRASRKQQSGDVGARDEQHHGGQPFEDDQRTFEPQTQTGISVIRSFERERLLDQTVARFRKLGEVALLQLFFDPLSVEHLRGGLCLLQRHTRLQPRERIEPCRAFIVEPGCCRRDGWLHRDRDEDFGWDAYARALEPWRGNADNGERCAVETNRLANDPLASLVLRLPEVVLEDGDWMSV